jgi:RHS repeat-associated protein
MCRSGDAESGLDNFGARYDASSLGRFMTPDPLLNSGHPANPQTWNRYTYALNNPLAIIDPTGLYNLVSHCVEGQKGYKSCIKNENRIAEQLRKGVDKLTKAAEKMKDGPEKARLQAALKALGTENDENNVFVSAGTLGKNVAAETKLGINSTTGELGFDVTFDAKKSSNTDPVGIAINAAHEGTHVVDESDPRYNNPDTTLSPFQTEYRGYQTSAWAASALGQPSLSYRNFMIWNSSWAAVDDAVLTRYITSFKDSKGNVTLPETTPHNPWPN